MSISFNTTTNVITVDATTRLQDVYTNAENTFSGSTYLQYLPPLQANTPTLFTLINGWTFSAGSIQHLTSAALQDSAGNNIWCNIQTLGSIVSGTTLYIQQGSSVTYTAGTTGHINILLPVKVAGSLISSGAFTVYARLFGQTYSSFTTTGGATVANVPLATQADINLTIPSVTLAAYSDMSITWGTYSEDVGDGAGASSYSVLIHTTNANRTLAQIYNWVQYKLLQSSDINAGTPPIKLGNITAPLVSFAGGTMFTAQGVFVSGFTSTNANNIQYTDGTGAVHTPPLSIPIVVNIDPSLVAGSNTASIAVFKLTTPYVAAAYNSSQISSTLINTTLSTGTTSASTSMTYSADFPSLVVVREAGFQSFAQGVTVSTGGLNVTSQNPVDTIYGV